MGAAALQGMSCEQLYVMYASHMKALKKLLHLPRKFLRKLVQLASYPFDRASNLLNEYLAVIKKSISDFLGIAAEGPSGLLNAMYNMATCPILWRMYGTLIQSIITAIESGLGAPMAMVNMLKNAIVSRANAVLKSLKNIVVNPLKQLYGKYEALLRSTGAMGILNLLADIQQCIKSLCGAYNSVKPHQSGDSPDIFKSLGLVITENEDGTTSVTVDIENTLLGKTVKKATANIVARSEKAWDQVKQVPSAVQDTASKAWNELKEQTKLLTDVKIPEVM